MDHEGNLDHVVAFAQYVARCILSATNAFDQNGWEDYAHWQTQDRKTLRRINQPLTDSLRDPFAGIGKPEPLKHHPLRSLVAPNRRR